jgi:hypothetical protein
MESAGGARQVSLGRSARLFAAGGGFEAWNKTIMKCDGSALQTMNSELYFVGEK